MTGKTAIVYVSKTGFTQRYAEWIAQRLGANALPFSQRRACKFADSATILFGSSLHAGRIRKVKWLKRRLPGWQGKRIVLFVTGAMPDGRRPKHAAAEFYRRAVAKNQGILSAGRLVL